jgi:uncharacterized damage-inducible protein DinB
MTTVGPHPIDSIALIFKLNNGLVARSLDGLSDEEVWRRPDGGGNPIGWILGHATASRATLLGRLGHPFDLAWGARFSRGSGLEAAAAYPARAAIEAGWNETHGRMRDAFAALTDARLADQPQGPPLPGVKSLADVIAFYAFHESYHVGQVAYVRRLLGRSAVAG